MWTTATAAFWSSLGLVGYTYAGYPLAINALARVRPRPVQRDSSFEPSLSIILAAHNEAERIAAKLDNLLALDYPRDRVQIIVVDDGSTDTTAKIIESYADRNVELIRVAQASGKPTALNRGMQRAAGELVVFCDARQRVDRGALKAIVPAFADSSVGAVSGELVIEGTQGPGVYWRYEKLVRMAESRFDSVVGATGAFYAIRRELFEPLPADALLDDVIIPMRVAMAGYRVLLEPGAKVYDAETKLRGEFSRKARTLAGNYQILRQLPGLLKPWRNRLFPQYASHKVARLAGPFALATLFGSNVVLVCSFAPGWPLYAATLAGQVACYGMAAYAAIKGEEAPALPRACQTFVVLNLAAAAGLMRFASGDLRWTNAART